MKLKRDKLSNLCLVFADGDWIETKDQSPSGIRLIQTGNIGDGIFKARDEKARYISEETFNRLKCTEVIPGDCLISRLPEPVGRSCIIPDIGERMITAVDCTIIRTDKKKLIPEFLNYFTQSMDYQSEVDTETTGTTRKRISRSRLGSVAIPLPPLAEQVRIVAILDQALAAIDTVKANTEKNLIQVHQVLQSFLQNIFNNPGSGWEEKRISEIATIKGGKRVPKGYKLKTNSTGHPYIRVTDFTDTGTIDLSDIHYIDNNVFETIKNYTISTNDLYISIAGTIGKTGIVPPELNNANLTENACKLVFIKNIDPKFVYFFTKTQNFIDQAGLNTRTTAMPKLALTRLATIKLFIPPSISDQKEVVEKAETLNSETIRMEEIYKQKLKLLSEFKQSILHKAFSGEL